MKINVIVITGAQPRERKECTADAPMPSEDAAKFYWIHADAVDVGAFLNVRLYTCPHCGITFHAPAREAPAVDAGQASS